jgi:acetyl-CoA C-acetyltransferase
MWSQFMGAEMIVKKHGFTKDQLDAFAYNSHLKAIAAVNAGAFKDEIVPIEIETPEGMAWHTQDEGIRFDATLESIAGVKLLAEGGTLTAASSSQICDGSSAALVVSEAALKRYNLTPLARVHTLTVTAGDPVIMLEEPLFATDKALARAGLSIGDIDRLRSERGVCAGADGLAEAHRCRSRAQRQWRRDCAGPSAGRVAAPS